MTGEPLQSRVHRIRKLIDRSLVVQYRMFGVLALIFLGLFARNLIHSDIKAGAGILALAAGYVIGTLLTKGTEFDWNQDTRKAVKQTNIFGIILLVVYLAFLVFKSTVLRAVLDIRDPRLLGAIGTGITAGVMLGRVVHTLQGIRLVLKALNPVNVAPRDPDDPPS